MESIQKLKQLCQFMCVEPAEDVLLIGKTPEESESKRIDGMKDYCKAGENELPIYHAVVPGGKRISLLKIVLTSACERNCNYCAFRAGRDFRRFTFSPDELAESFIQHWAEGAVEGLFLSSGVAGGGVRTQDRLLDTAEILRLKKGFQGYLHLKLMPGAEYDQILRAMQLANRVSINLEAPSPQVLSRLAPQKILMNELLRPLQWVEDIRQKQDPHDGWNMHWPSSCTQFVIGAAGENDFELLNAVDYLHKKLKLARIYYSAFKPVPDTPFENLDAAEPLRKIRLYQASFLLRDYGFLPKELIVDDNDHLPLNVDPKFLWAMQNLVEVPLEINKAGFQELLRVPGIGWKSAQEILKVRRFKTIKSLEELAVRGMCTKRAAPFLVVNGVRPIYQLPLF